MKKKLLCVAVAFTIAIALVGCKSSGKNENKGKGETDGAAQETTKVVLGDVIEGDYGDVQLCQYKGISAEKTKVVVTAEDVENEISNRLYDFAEYNEVDRESKKGDYCSFTYTASENGEVVDAITEEEEAYELCLGNEDFGPEVDAKLTGVKAGEHLEFQVVYDEEYVDETYAGKTIDYVIDVLHITEEILPELTDEFIKDNMDYADKKDMEEKIKEELTEQLKEESEQELQQNIMAQIIKNSKFSKVSQDLYEETLADVKAGYEEYMQMFGCETLEDLLGMFDMTEEDLEQEAKDQVYQIIVVHAIAKEQKITIDVDDYGKECIQLAEEYGYNSIEEMIEEYGDEALQYWYIEKQVYTYLAENAVVTEVDAPQEEEEEVEE